MKKIFLIIIVLLAHGYSYAKNNVLSGNVEIQENRDFKGTWTIKAGTKITLKKDVVCKFSGAIKFEGSKSKPILITGNGAARLHFEKCPETIIKHVSVTGLEAFEFEESMFLVENGIFSKNKIAIKTSKNSSGLIVNVSVNDNEIGVVSELKSRLIVQNSEIKQNVTGAVATQQGLVEIYDSKFSGNKTGIILNQDGLGKILNSKLSENDVAVAMNQNKGSVIERCSLADNKVGIHGEVYTYVNIASSEFKKNGTAISLVQLCTGKISDNSFTENETALILDKKSSPEIRYNTLKGNKVAIFCDFSSYPVITLNNFITNEYHIKLGIYQSADFENRVSSSLLQMQEAVARQSKKVLEIKDTKNYIGEVFAKNNYWDEKTTKEIAAGENVTAIYDGLDIAPVTYEGYGDERYKIDKVVLKPYLSKRSERRKK